MSRLTMMTRITLHAQRRPGIRSIVLAILLMALPRSTHAQSGFGKVGLGHGLAGIGFFEATDDYLERTQNPTITGMQAGSVGTMWLIDTAVFVSGRFGVGLEALPFGTVAGGSSVIVVEVSEQEAERAFFITGRWRALHRDRIAVDGVGGFGGLFQHRETRMSFRFPVSELYITEDRISLGFALGLDVPISIGWHCAIWPLARWYVLNRDAQNTRAAGSSAFGSSSRFAGITAGVIW